MANIFIGNLAFTATEDDLRKAFGAFGNVSQVALIKDKLTGKPRGFGFVEMADEAAATRAISALNGKEFLGRRLNVNQTRPRPDGREERPGEGQHKPGGRESRPHPGYNRAGGRESRPYPGYVKPEARDARPYRTRTKYEDRNRPVSRPGEPRKFSAKKMPTRDRYAEAKIAASIRKGPGEKKEAPKKQPFWAAVAKKSRPRNRKVAAKVRERKESRSKES
jgi:RNA recognition motif-containing protein